MEKGKNIIDKILSDAKAEAAELERIAGKDAEGLISNAKEKAEKERIKIVAAFADQAEKAVAREISAAQMKAKQMILSTKQKCISDTVNDARKKLAELESQEYKNIILDMILSAKPSESCEVILSAADKKILAEEIEKMGYKVADDVMDIKGGFIIRKGEIEYNYSFDSIISVDKEDIDMTAAQTLFA